MKGEAETGDLAAQQGLFRDLERLARRRGFDNAFDDWELDLAWLRGESAW